MLCEYVTNNIGDEGVNFLLRGLAGMLLQQVIRFILIGAINTLFGYTLYAFFIYIGSNYILAVLFATILGVLFNFQTIGKFVFKAKNNSLIVKFISVYVIVFFVNVLIITMFKLFGLNSYLAGFIAVVPCATISFILNKYFVFKEIK